MFHQIKKRIINFCNEYKVPVPEILRFEEQCPPNKFPDPMDVVEEDQIHLHVEGAGDLSLEGDQHHYASGIFCKYLCELQRTPKYEDHIISLMIEWMMRDVMDKDPEF